MDTESLGPFLYGMDNVSTPLDLDGSARHIEGLVVGSGGTLELVPGFSVVLPGNMHSGVTASTGDSYWIKDGVFGGWAGGEFKGILRTAGRASYTEFGGRLYVALREGLYYMDRCIPPLRRAGVPKLGGFSTGVTAGDSHGGPVLVSVSLLINGEEGPLCGIERVDVAPGETTVVRGLPTEPGVGVRIYATEPGGETLFLAVELAQSIETVVVPSNPEGAEAPKEVLEPFGWLEHITSFKGRLVGGAGDTLYYSSLNNPNLREAGYDFIKHVGDISILIGVGSGLLVGDDEGIWLYKGDELSSSSKELLSSVPAYKWSALDGSSIEVHEDILKGAELDALWCGPRGFEGISTEGGLISFSDGRFRSTEGLVGESHMFPLNGRTYVVSLVKSAELSGY